MQSTDKMGMTVLIVEDDASMLAILASRIADEGYTVLKAQDGQQGLTRAMNEHPDLILLDLLLPKLSGLELLNALRADERGKQIPAIILTNLNENDAIYKSVALRSTAYFIKSDSSLDHIAAEVRAKLGPARGGPATEA